MKLRARYHLGVSVVLLGLAAISSAEDVKLAVKEVPRCLPSEERKPLLAERSGLLERIVKYNTKADVFLGKCGSIRSDDSARIQYCSEEKTRLESVQSGLVTAGKDFKGNVERALKQREVEAPGELVAAMNAESQELQAKVYDAAFPRKLRGQRRQPKGPFKTTDNPTGREASTDNCQEFFRGVVSKLGQRRGQTGEEWANAFPDMSAHSIAKKLLDPAQRPASWRPSDRDREAQKFANRGAIVIGVTPAPPSDPDPHGHVAIVFPLPRDFDPKKFDGDKIKRGKQAGSGPFVRDGNEHGKTSAASSWGAVRASRVASPEKTHWYLFVPSLCATEEE